VSIPRVSIFCDIGGKDVVLFVVTHYGYLSVFSFQMETVHHIMRIVLELLLFLMSYICCQVINVYIHVIYLLPYLAMNLYIYAYHFVLQHFTEK
jgi:hypothetical protein